MRANVVVQRRGRWSALFGSTQPKHLSMSFPRSNVEFVHLVDDDHVEITFQQGQELSGKRDAVLRSLCYLDP